MKKQSAKNVDIKPDDIDNDWFIRDNPEFDEKLPLIGQQVFNSGIDYESDDSEDVDKIIAALDKNLFSFDDMTADEVEDAIGKVRISAALADLSHSGMVSYTEDGSFLLTDSGKQQVNKLLNKQESMDSDVE